MKKIISLILTVCLALPLFSCSSSLESVNEKKTEEAKKTAVTQETQEETMENAKTTEPEVETTPYQPVNSSSIQHPLDGKKFLFIGNSFTYYGKTVLEKNRTVLEQSARDKDKGFFYQLAKENGADIEVTNWTFGGHTLHHTFGGSCAADRGCDGVDHTAYLTDRYFDYVMIQEGSGVREDFPDTVKGIMNLFREENPNVKFFFLTHRSLYTKNLTVVLENLKNLEDLGVTIVDWGKLVVDVISGETQIPGSTEEYNQNSFIVSKSAADGYHPNMLTGYITTLMTWCAVTGESAVGQEYRFCGNTTVNKAYDFEKFKNTYYTYGNTSTNFDKILTNKTEILGIQQVIDRYLAEKAYRNY